MNKKKLRPARLRRTRQIIKQDHIEEVPDYNKEPIFFRDPVDMKKEKYLRRETINEIIKNNPLPTRDRII